MSEASADRKPLIVAFVDDLMVGVKITSVADRLGYRVIFIASEGELGEPADQPPPNRPAEAVYGPDATLQEQLTAWQPALLIFDLANDQIPWRRWLALLKSSPATRRIPALCYAPHVETEALRDAHERAADAVLTRGRFLGDLPQFITSVARQPDRRAINHACAAPLSELALHGVTEFNHGNYFEAHELLEEAWNEDDSAAREAYRGVLQVAVAYLQIQRGNYQGAVKMFLRARQWLDPLPDVCRGIDIGRLKTDAAEVHRALLEAGPDGLVAFDRSLFRPVTLFPVTQI
jgi:hypothetical protein